MKIQRKFIIVLTLIAALAVMTGLSAGATESAPTNTKQIAAPPAEFADLQLPNPAEIGIRSSSAMIPVTLQPDGNGGLVWDGTLHIDNGANAAIIVFAPEAGQWHVTLQPDSDEAILLNSQTRRPDVTRHLSELSLGNEGHLGEVYAFTQLTEGSVPVQVTAVAPTFRTAANSNGVDGFLLVASKQSQYHIFTHLSSHNLLVGNEIGLVTYGYDDMENSEGRPEAMADLIQEASLTLTKPNSRKIEMPMFDDGQHADGEANDGVFGALINADMVGDYIGQVTVTGTTPEGQPFMRTSEHIFPVIASNLSLDETLTRVTVNGDRLQINLRATGVHNAPEQLQMAAQVWGANAANEMVPVAWIGGIITPIAKGNHLILPLHLDANWIGMAKATSNFELRDVRVQDVNTHIPMAQSDHIELASFRLPAVARHAVTEITDTMLMGQRPEHLDTPRSPNAGKLMLVHGYCSGNVWPASQFSNDVTFQDYNQNRSHNQFAQLIDSYGDNFSSFGIVAHSQGGAASLHLYANYWSGLDSASGNRRIQSVGTPYQGTSLAGMLALLGQIFGIGCGTNFDLTYSGASLWLAGIPSWARDDVYYATTSFKDKWWRYDYCQIASDLVLDDPDDGTTEKWSGQLSGANNLGHKTGWCHTTSMRDPAQYLDSSRNSNMNANAAR